MLKSAIGYTYMYVLSVSLQYESFVDDYWTRFGRPVSQKQWTLN